MVLYVAMYFRTLKLLCHGSLFIIPNEVSMHQKLILKILLTYSKPLIIINNIIQIKLLGY